MQIEEKDVERLKVLAERAQTKFMFIDVEDLTGDLNKTTFRICDNQGKLLFTLNDTDLETAAYITSINNVFIRGLK